MLILQILLIELTLKFQSQKMIKHTQAIRWLLPTNCLRVFDHFVELALKGLKGSFKVFELIHAPFSHVSIKISEIWQVGAISKFLPSVCRRRHRT